MIQQEIWYRFCFSWYNFSHLATQKIMIPKYIYKSFLILYENNFVLAATWIFLTQDSSLSNISCGQFFSAICEIKYTDHQNLHTWTLDFCKASTSDILNVLISVFSLTLPVLIWDEKRKLRMPLLKNTSIRWQLLSLLLKTPNYWVFLSLSSNFPDTDVYLLIF